MRTPRNLSVQPSQNPSSRTHSKTRSSSSNVSAAAMALKASAVENLKARERKLRDDPMVIILSPKRVQCSRCGIEIQLSKKSDFDPCHWSKHRERCLRKEPDREARDKRLRGVAIGLRPRSSWPTEVKIVHAPRQQRRAPSVDSNTPSLSPDIDERPVPPHPDHDQDQDVEQDQVPLSPLSSICMSPSPVPSAHTHSLSPVSPAHTLVPSPTPRPRPHHIDLPKSGSVTSSTVVDASPLATPPSFSARPRPHSASQLPSAPPASGNNLAQSRAHPDLPIIRTSTTPFRLDYRSPPYAPDSDLSLSGSTPLDFPPTEYFRWSQLRTSYRSPSPSERESTTAGDRSEDGSDTTRSLGYRLSAARFDDVGMRSWDAESVNAPSAGLNGGAGPNGAVGGYPYGYPYVYGYAHGGQRMGFPGFPTGQCRFAH